MPDNGEELIKSLEDHKAKAKALWQSFDENEKAGVRFGMFPYDPMKQAEYDQGFDGHLLCLLLMQEAEDDVPTGVKSSTVFVMPLKTQEAEDDGGMRA